MLSQVKATKRVARGAALLDEKAPGWAEKIDIGLLDIGHPSFCICGQLSAGRGWSRLPAGLGSLFIEVKFAEEHGVLSSGWITDEMLGDAWIAAIADRVVAPVPAEHAEHECARIEAIGA